MIETCGVALIGVTLFYFVHIPLPWLLGSLTAVMTWRIVSKRPLYWPFSLRQGALILLGYLLGSSFTKETLLLMADHVPSMLFMTVMTILFSVLLGYGISKLTGLDMASCVIGGVPGGLSQMVILSEEMEGLQPTIVAFMQTMRVVAVICIVPFLTVSTLSVHAAKVAPIATGTVPLTWTAMPWLTYVLYPALMVAGASIANRVRLPTSYLIGPLVVTVALVITGLPTPPPPDVFVTAAQFMIGTHIGLQMKPTELHNWKKVTLYTVISSVLLVLFAFGLSYILTQWHHLEITTAFLGTAPGGMAEMGVTAAVVGADLSIVSSYQLFRLLTMMLIMPYVLKWFVKMIHR